MEHPMRALVHDPDAPHGLRLGEALDPELGPSDALVRVAATSLNFGEVAFLRERVAPGAVAGWDASGTVVAAAADGSGPPTDARVATFGWSGAWAQRRAVDTGELAVLPDAVDFGAAAALPVAGVTALRAVRRLGSVVGRRVLITGASGGVGRFAVQLAARAGAHVVAAVGSSEREEGLAELGASEVVVGLSDLTEPVHAAVDNVGGQMLAEVLARLAPGGCVLSVGMASLQPTTIDFEQMRMRAGSSRIEAFTVGSGFGADLAYLVSLLGASELDPQIGWRGSWDRAGEAADALIGRRVRGKAILEVVP
jgi:NADPH:quinone reductase-like Zn-dependent oxidoreductase